MDYRGVQRTYARRWNASPHKSRTQKSTRVNKPENDDPSVLEPVALTSSAA
jgi:hypothetical protein